MLKDKVTVSVVMITYNHELYIKEAIEGVLMQECSFNVELIIADDNSPDKTEEIVLDIIKNHKHGYWISYVKHKKNKGMMPNFIWALKKATGQYIALCEGDDYWIDPLKLQKQVDFLEENEDCAASFHASQNVKETNNGEIITENSPSLIPKNNKYSTIDIIKLRGGNMSTNSLLFRSKHMHSLPEWYHEVLVGDLPLKLILAYKGDFGYIDRVMSCYRIEVKEGWTSQNLKNTKKRRKVIISIIVFWKRYNIYTKKSYKSEVRKAILGEYVLYVKVHIYYIAQRLGIK